MKAMNVKEATTHPKATEEICGMLDMIGTLIEKGHVNVPARTPVTPGRFPVWLPFLFGFPEDKVKRIFLLVFPCHKQGTVSSLQIIQILMGKLSISLKTPGSDVQIGREFFYGEGYQLLSWPPDALRSMLQCHGLTFPAFFTWKNGWGGYWN